ncbi:hypothetical protein [Bacterioplanes sanyensis]|uniref:hypothetical protein n=1 Tax=Bacterioplanes sanyensis TaxID=1249553 RepID=UPI001671E294|nr:hypothetical protein [Bacterioplanes sanyensis]
MNNRFSSSLLLTSAIIALSGCGGSSGGGSSSGNSLDSGKALFEQFKKIEEASKKSEFETQAEYEERVSKFFNNLPDFTLVDRVSKDSYYLFTGLHAIGYDAEMQELRITQPDDDFSHDLEGVTYTTTTIIGDVELDVASVELELEGLDSLGKTYATRENIWLFGDEYRDYDFYAAIPMAPDVAERMMDAYQYEYVIRFSQDYIDDNGMYCQNYVENCEARLKANVTSVVLKNTETGEVY